MTTKKIIDRLFVSNRNFTTDLNFFKFQVFPLKKNLKFQIFLRVPGKVAAVMIF